MSVAIQYDSPNRRGQFTGALLDNVPVVDKDMRAEAGANWADVTLSGTQAVGVKFCTGDTSDKGPTFGVRETFTAFAVVSGFECSNAGAPDAELIARAHAELDSTASHAVATELWSGALTIANSWNNSYLGSTATTVIAGGFQAPVEALAELERASATCVGRKIIHVTTVTLQYLFAVRAIYLVGNTWFTPTGNVVVADQGYPGTAPGVAAAATMPDTAYMYATPMFEILRGPVETFDPHYQRNIASTNNTRHVTVYRAFVPMLPDSCVYAAGVTHCSALETCS